MATATLSRSRSPRPERFEELYELAYDFVRLDDAHGDAAAEVVVQMIEVCRELDPLATEGGAV